MLLLYDRIQALSPKNDAQRSLQALASMYRSRNIAIAGRPGFLARIVFTGFGLFAPTNGTVMATLFLCAISVSGAIFLILEMYTPYEGLIQISSDPLRAALAHLGQ